MTSKAALVTGGNRGIGLEICRQLGVNGFHVFLATRTLAKGQCAADALRQHGINATAVELDVASEASMQKLVETLNISLSQLDVLVNNAGIMPDAGKGGLEFTKEGLIAGFETNTLGPLFLSRALLPLLEKSKSAQIINISSGMGQLSTMRDGNVAYRISKAGLNAVTQILSSELSDKGIMVNSVCPGWVKTDMGGKNAPLTTEQGADTAVWLALGGADGASGGFYRNRTIIPW